MIYRDFPSIVKRIFEVKEFKTQATIFVVGIFSTLFYSALFEGYFSLLISATSIFILGILVITSKKSLVMISDNGPMKEVNGKEAVNWGFFYLIFGTILLLFYFLIK